MVGCHQVKFLCPVYHPQVNSAGERVGEFCADFVSKGWSPSRTVRTVLQQMLQLLASPEADGALEASIGAQVTSDLEAFEKKASAWTAKYASIEGDDDDDDA